MERNWRSDRWLREIGPETEACVNCQHFCRHYLQNGTPMWSGHCLRGRFGKLRRLLDVCDRFEESSGKLTPEGREVTVVLTGEAERRLRELHSTGELGATYSEILRNILAAGLAAEK